MNVFALIATIPARKRSCERLLGELERQTWRPHGVILVLDGYGTEPAPKCTLPVAFEHRTQALSGAGQRWLVAGDHVAPEDIVVCLDDDVMLTEAPRLVAALLGAIAFDDDCAAAAMGFDADGKQAPPGMSSRGELVYAAGNGLAVRGRHLAGLREFAAGVRAAGSPDALGLLGDDDALVSAHLWKKGIKIMHAATGNIFPAPGTRASSQTVQVKGDPNAQKKAIRSITGWPWKGK